LRRRGAGHRPAGGAAVDAPGTRFHRPKSLAANSPVLPYGGMKFELIGPIEHAEVIAAGPGVRVRSYLRKVYGHGRWRKMKGTATVRLANGALRRVELLGMRRMGLANET
jgi:hypothetical protein